MHQSSMTLFTFAWYRAALMVLLLIAAGGCGVVNSSTEFSDTADSPATRATPARSHISDEMQTAILAGGCFWGVEAVYEHVNGVIDVRSGYAGGDAKTAKYNRVSSGGTGHAEAVKITYDPAIVSYEQLLNVFFSVAHDPTQLNRQGPDIGSQYRSAIFYTTEDQKKTATDHIAALNQSKKLSKPVVTRVVPLTEFFEAEAYHQDYLEHHLDEPYIVTHDLPKLEALKKIHPDLYVKK